MREPEGRETMARTALGANRPAWRASAVHWLPTVAAVLLCAGALGWLQFSFRGLEDGDSYFHTRAARELDLHGVRRTFPQAGFSTWSTRYSDKDWLFHVFLIPFQRAGLRASGTTGDPSAVEDLVTPGKSAMAVLYLLLFSALAWALRASRARYPWLWILLYLGIDRLVLYRLLPVRPGILGVLFVLLEVGLVARRNGPGLAAAGALHAYSHSSMFLAPLLAGVTVAARFVRQEPLPLRLLAWSVAGPLAAFVVHPYFPNNLGIAWEQLAGVAQNVWFGSNEIPVELFGEELLGMSTAAFVGWAPGLLPAAGGIVAFLAGPRRISTDGLALTLFSGLLLAAGFLSFRFMDFFLPVAVVLGARLWSELAGAEPLRALARRSPRGVALAGGLLALCLAGVAAKRSVLVTHEQIARTVTGQERQRHAVEFLRRAAAPEDVVYHSFWYDFAVLYHYRPEGRYIEALDPIFFHRHDPRLFRESVAIMNGTAADPHGVIRGDFGADWVFVTKHYLFERMAQSLARDARFRLAYEDDEALVYRVE